MNKKGQTIILVAWVLLAWAVLSIGFSIYEFSEAKEVCEYAEGKVSIEHRFMSKSLYSCIINNSKYEMVKIVGNGLEIIDYVKMLEDKK